MAIYFYCRVSTFEQHEDRQIDMANELGVMRENIFLDKQSGKNIARPALQQLMSIVRQGDTVIVESVSRFARNTRDLLELIDKLAVKGVEFVSQKEHIDTTTPTGKFMLTVFGAVAELERGYILQRQAEGIAAAKRRGVSFGRPLKTLPENFAVLVKEWEQGKLTATQVIKQSGLSRATFYRRIREFRAERERAI